VLLLNKIHNYKIKQIECLKKKIKLMKEEKNVFNKNISYKWCDN